MSCLQNGCPSPPGAVHMLWLGRPPPARGRDASEHALPPRRALQVRPRDAVTLAGPSQLLRPPLEPEPGRVPRGPGLRRERTQSRGHTGWGPGHGQCAGCGPGGRQHRGGHGLSPVDTKEPRAGARAALPTTRSGPARALGAPVPPPHLVARLRNVTVAVSGELPGAVDGGPRRAPQRDGRRRSAGRASAGRTCVCPSVGPSVPGARGRTRGLGAGDRAASACGRGRPAPRARPRGVAGQLTPVSMAPGSGHGPPTSREELEGGPGVPTASGAQGTLRPRH